MTKLLQWLFAASLFMGIWVSLLMTPLSDAIREVLIPLPIYLLMVFACYSLAVIGYRVATFNDCKEASEELKKQVEEARQDLKKKGMKFD